jgi:hypothetical protein
VSQSQTHVVHWYVTHDGDRREQWFTCRQGGEDFVDQLIKHSLGVDIELRLGRDA